MNRALKDMTERLEDAEAELKAIFRTDDRLIDMLRMANDTVEQVQCQVVIAREEKFGEGGRQHTGKQQMTKWMRALTSE